MVAPDVVLFSVTFCAAVYGPPAGLNVGAATAGAIVYVALLTELSAIPVRYAIALIVVVALTVIALLYSVPEVLLGVLPFVVYRMEAFGVALLNVTCCVVGYVPAPGLNAGAATVIVYAAELTLLAVIPVLYAIALIVRLAFTGTAVLYTVPEVALGVLPSVV